MTKWRWPYLVVIPVLALVATVAAGIQAGPLATVGPGEIRRRIMAIGVEVPKKGTALVRARASGEIRRVYVAEAATVQQGQLLAELENTAVAAELRRLQAVRDSTAESLQGLVGGARKDELAAADAELEAAELEWAMAEDRAKRQEMLGPAKSEAAVAQARWEAELAKSRLNATRARHSLTQLGARSSEIREARFKLAAAQAAVDEAQAALERTHIASPIDGTVLTVRAHEGDSILGTSSDPVLFELANLSQTELRSEVDADDARLVQQGLPVRVLQDAVEVGTGAVTRMSEVLERRTNGRANGPELSIRNVWMEVRWNGDRQQRGPLGGKYQVEIELPRLHAPAVVPRTSIRIRDGASTIAIREWLWTRHLRVELGSADDKWVQVLNVPSGTRLLAK